MANWDDVSGKIDKSIERINELHEKEEAVQQCRLDHLNRGIQQKSMLSLLAYGVSVYYASRN